MFFAQYSMKWYVNTTMACMFARAVAYDNNGHASYYSKKTRQDGLKEMLLVDKIGRVTGRTVAALCMACYTWGGFDVVRPIIT